MNFENSLMEGYVKIVSKNESRARSFIKSSSQAVKTAVSIQLGEETKKSIFRELYEGLRQFCEAIGFFKGFKFQSHEAISYFLLDFLKEERIAREFDRYRKIRNRINYYGEEIDVNTVKEALKEIPEIITSLNKYII